MVCLLATAELCTLLYPRLPATANTACLKDKADETLPRCHLTRLTCLSLLHDSTIAAHSTLALLPGCSASYRLIFAAAQGLAPTHTACAGCGALGAALLAQRAAAHDGDPVRRHAAVQSGRLCTRCGPIDRAPCTCSATSCQRHHLASRLSES